MEQRLWRKHSRSALHSQWAHGLETELHDIAALWGELMVTTLEALLVVHDDLEDRGWALLKISDLHVGEKTKWDVNYYKSSTPVVAYQELY